jgi:outer membrane cobalamin receptor
MNATGVLKYVMATVFAVACAAGSEAEEEKVSDSAQAVDEVETIVVTGTVIPTYIGRLGAEVTTIPKEVIQDSIGLGVSDLLAREGAGFDGSIVTDSSPPNLSLRGLPGNYQSQRLLFIYDGVPMRDAYVGGFNINTLGLADAGQIEIGKGLASHLYGSGAMGGVVQLLPLPMPSQGFEGRMSVFGESFGGLGASALVGLGDSGVGVQAFGQAEKSDGYLVNPDGSNQWTRSSYAGVREQFMFPGDLSGRLGLIHDRYEINASDFVSDTQSETLYGRLLGSDALTDLTVWQTSADTTLDWKAFPGQDRISMKSDGIKWMGTSRLGANDSRGTGHYGVEVIREAVDAQGVSGNIQADDTDSALLGGLEISSAGQAVHTFSLGARLDHSKQFGFDLSPRASYVYLPSERNRLYVAIGKSYRSPQASDLYLPPTSYGGMTFEGNPNLTPETALGAETGWSLQSGGHRLSLAGYYTFLNDGWDYMMDPDMVLRPHNVTKITARGVELSWHWAKGRFATGADYSFTDSIYEEDKANPAIEGNAVEDIPRHQGKVFAEFKGKEKYLPWALRAELRVASERPDNADNTAFLQGFALVNVCLEIGANDRLGKLLLAVDNAFDEVYEASLVPAIPGKPRSFRLGYVKTF